jgi:hypothetical protein
MYSKVDQLYVTKNTYSTSIISSLSQGRRVDPSSNNKLRRTALSVLGISRQKLTCLKVHKIEIFLASILKFVLFLY